MRFDEDFLVALNIREPAVAESLKKTKLIEGHSDFPAHLYSESSELILDIDFVRWHRLSVEEKVCWLSHEYLHYFLGHWKHYSFSDLEKWHTAADLAVNSLLGQQYDISGLFRLPSEYNLPEGLSGVQYYHLLESSLDQESDNSGWSYNMKPYIQPSYVSLGDSLAGTNAGNSIISRSWSRRSKWQSEYRKFCADNLGLRTTSLTRFSRRYGSPFLGKRKVRSLKAKVIIDTSSSMIPFFEQIANEVIWLSKNVDVDIYHCDTEVTKSIPDTRNVNFHGLGGTDLNPALEHVQGANATVVFTDGDFTFEIIKVRTPILWIIFGEKDFSPGYGRVKRVR